MLVEKCSNPGAKIMETGYINSRIAVVSDADWDQLKFAAPAPQPADEDPLIPWATEPRLDKGRVRRLTIIANVYMGRNLISADDDGLCDPTLIFDHHGSAGRSSTYMKSLNPVWNERIVINSFLFDDWLPPLVVKCLDKDEGLILGDSYECLGLVLVKLKIKNILKTGDPSLIPIMEWHLVRDGNDSNTASLLMSFTLLLTETQLSPKSLYPMNHPKDHYLIKLYILGLRDLQSSGLFSVKNPYIKFHAGALKNSDKSKGGNTFDILTSRCKKGGPNASFADVLT